MPNALTLWQAVLIVAGAFMGFAGFVFVLIKFAEPIKNFFLKVDKVKHIEKNYENIKKISTENQSQTEEIKSLKKDVARIDERLGGFEETLKYIKCGVECLLGASLGLMNDPERSTEIYRNLTKC